MRSITVSITTALLTAGLMSVPLVPRLLANELPIQSTSPTGPGDEAGSATGAQGSVSPGAATTIPEESAPPMEGSDIQERGLLPSKLSPGAVQGGTLMPLPKYTAPTPTLNFVANAIQLSFPATNTVDLRVPENPALTVPVEISVAYSTSGRRLTETYKPATGIQLRYVDDLRDGLPRLMRLDIALRELIPNGKSFTFSTQFTMTPRFNVTVTPLKFFLYADCDTVGKSDIHLYWTSPDGRDHMKEFKLNGGQTREIAEFGWSARNVGLANLFEPGMRFNEKDPDGQFIPGGITLTRKLAPPTIKDFNYIVHEDYDKFCKARVTYRIVLTLL
jgi:hypothetical protein